jgi:uncharacterized protein (TIGR03067 family)
MRADQKAVQGTWLVAELEADGHKMPASMLGGAKVVIKGDLFMSHGMGATYEGDVELDAAQSPKHFTLKFTKGPEKGNTNPGIYELDGDTWRICIATRGGERPKKFATKAGSGHALETLVREGSKTAGARAKTEEAAAPVDTAPPHPMAKELAGEWTMVSGVGSGETLPASYVKSGKRVATDTEITVSYGGQVFIKARYRIDPSTAPMSIDYVHIGGMAKGQTTLGIFELAGGALKTCMASPGQPRPESYASKLGDGRTSTVWKRKK